MKKHTPMAVAIASALGMLVLILDAKTALSGAAAGVELCIRTVIPSLFPFFFLSVMLTATLVGRALPPLRWLGRLLRLPEGAECIYITGLLGGYPVGAQNIAVACSFIVVDHNRDHIRKYTENTNLSVYSVILLLLYKLKRNLYIFLQKIL